MATIKDVSKLAGVSVATVSRVINNKGYVGKETRENIEKAMEMLKYTPNDIARRLAGKKSNTIGLVIPDILNPFFPEIARAVEDTANELGYNIILCNTDNSSKKEKQYFDMLFNKQVDGIIISSYTVIPETLLEIMDKNMPVVVIDNKFEGTKIPTVTSNNKNGGRLATEHLLECGATKIAYIGGYFHIKAVRERYEGYEEVCKEKNIYYPSIIRNCDFTLKSGYDITKELLENNNDINGIFAGNDIVAAGAYKALVDMGYNVPNDIKLIGYDGLISNTDYLEISSVGQQIYACGRLSVEVLYKLIKDEELEQDTFVLNVDLIKRKSTIGENKKL